MTASLRKRISIFVAQDAVDTYGEKILSGPFIKFSLAVGFLAVKNLDIRNYIMLGKSDKTHYIRVWVNHNDPYLLEAYELFENEAKPDLFWTSLFMKGLEALGKNGDNLFNLSNTKQQVSPIIPPKATAPPSSTPSPEVTKKKLSGLSGLMGTGTAISIGKKTSED